jgi:hypothetical protein
MRFALHAVAVGLVLLGCSSSTSDTGSSGSSGTSGSSGSSGSSGTSGSSGGTDAGTKTTSGSCETDPLRTGLVAEQTGVSVDAFDCQILAETAANREPDAMIFKALIYVESRFDQLSAGCPNMPCGMPSGWTADETGCYGLMQIVPACKGAVNAPGLLPDGHPNLTKDKTASGWAGSNFNPDINIKIGVAGIAGNRDEVVKLFPGCTEDEYTMMAVGNIANHGSTKSCTVYNTEYTNLVLDAYKRYSLAAGYAARAY